MPYERLNLSTSSPILSWASHDLAAEETKMAKNVASLPFVFKHVALMPDVHLGKGALVGSVVATKEAVIPAAVGVDIGCFTGDTLIPLVDGKAYPIAQLATLGKSIGVYSCTPMGRIVAAEAIARLTRHNAPLVKVILDNGETIKCTPDHQFMLRDGTYIEARHLKPGTSLMPFYSKTDKDGYTLIQQNYSSRWQKAHWLIARSGLLGEIPKFETQRTVIHHKNFIPTDNRPENLEFMGNKEHSSYHRSLVERNTFWQSPEFEQKRKLALAAKAQTEEGHQYFAQRGTKNILQYMHQNSEHFKQSVSGNGKRGRQYLIDYNTSAKNKAKSKEIANRSYTCELCGIQTKSPIGLHNHRKYQHNYNHKVIEVINLPERQDVYCLSVPEYGNFALKAGVFVHNCGMAAIKMPFSGDRLEGKLKQIRLDIEASIPVGFSENKEIEKSVTNWQGWRNFKDLHRGVQDLEGKAIKQLGSLGGGNHFIEVCLDAENQIWLMLHSGSRGIGNQLAQRHIASAKNLARLSDIRLPDLDLAYFIAKTPEFEAYWRDLQWAQDYARFNREVMMSRFKRIVEKHLAGGKPTKPLLSVNCHHNYAEKEVHFGEEVYVTRKGAVRAREEDYGIIPGSMGAKSFIVKGKGSHDSYCSCFPAGTMVLTESGMMAIEDIFNSPIPIKLISYNQDKQKFEPKKIAEMSVRKASVDRYSVSQTRRRLDNLITCTPNHPFATYERGILSYKSVEDISSLSSGVIVPTHIDLPSNLTIEEQDGNFYYLLGVILSDGTLYFKERKSAPDRDRRNRDGQYLHAYVRIYQSAHPSKQSFLTYLERVLKFYTNKVSRRIQKPRTSNLQGRSIEGKELIELTINDLGFVQKIQKIVANLSNILLSNPYLALYFLAGYLDGDGSYHRDTLSISVGKKAMFSSLICTLLSLGIAYRVYRNRNHYVIEFRDRIIQEKLRSLCQRLTINEPPKRVYSDKLVLAKSMAGGDLKCRELNAYAKSDKAIDVNKFKGQSIDLTLTMNRVFKIESGAEMSVYNFTVEDNHNYIVFTKYYTPLLVHNCSHGAGRLMSRTKAKKHFTLDDLIEQTQGIECRKDEGVLDEIPGAYKPIEEVMDRQSDLVEVVATLKQVLCIKG